MLGSAQALSKTIDALESLRRRVKERGEHTIYVRSTAARMFQVAYDAELIARGQGVAQGRLNQLHYRPSRSARAVPPDRLAARVVAAAAALGPACATRPRNR